MTNVQLPPFPRNYNDSIRSSSSGSSHSSSSSSSGRTSGTRPRKRNRKGSSVVGIAAATLVVIAKSAFFRFCLSCSMPSTFGTYMFGPSLYVYAYNKVFQSLARNPSPPCALGPITYDAISFAGIYSTAAASVRFSRHCAQRTASRGRGLRLALTAAVPA